MQLSGTVAPWLVGGFVILAVAMLAQTLRAWREAKRSPYFFLRIQAQKRLRQYSSASLAMILLASATAAYGWDAPKDETPRTAILVNNKPVAAASEQSSDQVAQTVDQPAPVLILDPTSSLIDRPAPATTTTDESETNELALPTEFNQLSPNASLQDDTTLGAVAFSTAVTERYEAVNPGRTFGEGYFTLYATFAYDGMEDGLVWSWVWMRDGEVVSGGNEMWRYGNDGPGYVYLNPEEGFAAGQYQLGIWINGNLMAEGTFLVTTSAASQR
jgi:hypothetical protein